MFPQKKIKTQEDTPQKQAPYHSESNLLQQTIEWINFLNSDKKIEDLQNTDTSQKIEMEEESNSGVVEKLNTTDFAKFNNITKKN